MKNTKLIQLLKTFSVSEFNEFGKFLNSPFHNENLKMRLLYDFLKKYHPHFSHKELTKENAYCKLYSANEKYDDKKLRERCSDMMRLAEEYLSFVYIKKHPLEFKRQTLYEFRDRGLDVHFNKKNKEIREILNKTKVKDIEYFLNEYYYEYERSVFYESRQLLGKRKSVYYELVNEIDLFVKYFSSRMILYYTTMYNWEESFNYKFEFRFYNNVMKFIEDNNLTEYPFINALYLRLKIKENEEDDSNYYKLKDLYFNNVEGLEHQHKIRIGTMLINHALRRFMKGKKQFEAERFEVMKFQLEHDMYADESGWLSREKYFNYVYTAISLGYLEWAEKFIENYTIRIEPNKRMDAYSYVKGLLCFHKNEHDSALEELSRIKGGDYVYHLRIKALHTKIYFELMDYEKVLLIIDSFKHYISSNLSVPGSMKKNYTNYINILHKLTKLKFNKDEYSIGHLIQEIENFSINELTTNKPWLLEKALELKVGANEFHK